MVRYMYKVSYLDTSDNWRTIMAETKHDAEDIREMLVAQGRQIVGLSKWTWKTEIED